MYEEACLYIVVEEEVELLPDHRSRTSAAPSAATSAGPDYYISQTKSPNNPYFAVEDLNESDRMSNSRSPSPSPPDDDIPDERADMPLTLAASVILDALPNDAAAALQQAGELPQPKSMLPPIDAYDSPSLTRLK